MVKPSEKMCQTWRAALKRLTQDANLRKKLGRWKVVLEDRRYEWMQDGSWVYVEKGEIRKHRMTAKERRKATFDERS